MLLLAVTTEQADDGSNGGLHDLQAIAEAELDMRVRELTPVFFSEAQTKEPQPWSYIYSGVGFFNWCSAGVVQLQELAGHEREGK